MERQRDDFVVGVGIGPLPKELKVDSVEIAPRTTLGGDQRLLQRRVGARHRPKFQLGEVDRLTRSEGERLDCRH